jgi:hypothetical protein
MKRTSRAIERKITRLRALTLHISPYPTGLAPETRNVVEYMNAEAKRLRTGVQFTATANRIDAKGAIEAAAWSNTLGGWFIRRALRDGYLDGEEAVLRRGNSAWRKHLRKNAKTKAGQRTSAADEAAIRNRKKTRHIAEVGDLFFDRRAFGRDALIPRHYPKAWIHGVYMPIFHPDRPKR